MKVDDDQEPKRGRGRPQIGKRVVFYAPFDLVEQLETLSRECDVPVSQVIRELLEAAL